MGWAGRWGKFLGLQFKSGTTRSKIIISTVLHLVTVLVTLPRSLLLFNNYVWRCFFHFLWNFVFINLRSTKFFISLTSWPSIFILIIIYYLSFLNYGTLSQHDWISLLDSNNNFRRASRRPSIGCSYSHCALHILRSHGQIRSKISKLSIKPALSRYAGPSYSL